MLVYIYHQWQLLIFVIFFRISRLCWLQWMSCIFFFVSAAVMDTNFSHFLWYCLRGAASLLLSLYMSSFTFHRQVCWRYCSIKWRSAASDHCQRSLAGVGIDISLSIPVVVITTVPCLLHELSVSGSIIILPAVSSIRCFRAMREQAFCLLFCKQKRDVRHRTNRSPVFQSNARSCGMGLRLWHNTYSLLYWE